MHKLNWFRKLLAFALLFVLISMILPMESALAQEVDLGTLSFGDIIIDPASVWEFKEGANYSGEAFRTEPVEWMVVNHDHFSTGSTLLISKELVALYPFNDPMNNKEWSSSDLRSWLRGEFYDHLSPNFQGAIELTTHPSAWASDETVFVLAALEMGSSAPVSDPEMVDSAFLSSIARIAQLNEVNTPYWTRTPDPDDDVDWRVYNVESNGVFVLKACSATDVGVRPAVNLASDTQVIMVAEGVYELATPVTGVSLDLDKLTLTAGGDTATLVATVQPADAHNQAVTWSSSDETVATVVANSPAVVTPVGPGTATITVTTVDGEYSAECAVTVSAVAAETEGEEPELPKTGGARYHWLFLSALMLAIAGVLLLRYRSVGSDSI